MPAMLQLTVEFTEDGFLERFVDQYTPLPDESVRFCAASNAV